MFDKKYCGVICLGGGASWSYGKNLDEVSIKAAKQCKQDWKYYFDRNKKQSFKVNIFDITDVDNWVIDRSGVFDVEKNEKVELLEVREVTL